METTKNDRERNAINRKTNDFHSLTTTKMNIDLEGLNTKKRTIELKVNPLKYRRSSLYDRTLNKLLRKLRPI